MNHVAPTDRATVRRMPERGAYDTATIEQILDEGLICHVGFVTADGTPAVIPTTYARDGDHLVIHGSPASRMLRALKDGVDVCVVVTLIDGMVLARSTFHHSMNYRSVVVYGRATEVRDLDDRRRALDRLVEHLVPGRTSHARGPTDQELRGTLVLRLPLAESSAKVRIGPPLDDEADMTLPVWAGVLPIGVAVGVPVPDAAPDGPPPVPDHVSGWRRGAAAADR